MIANSTLRRLLIGIATLPAFGIAVLAIQRPNTPAPLPPVPQEPLEFKEVMQRISEVHYGKTRKEVENLIGPPTERSVWRPEFKEPEELFRNGGYNVFFTDPDWHQWLDPNDKNRWVAVVYTGRFYEQTVYRWIKRGF